MENSMPIRNVNNSVATFTPIKNPREIPRRSVHTEWMVKASLLD